MENVPEEEKNEGISVLMNLHCSMQVFSNVVSTE